MAQLQYPERDLEQDKDLEVFFLMRKAHITEIQARSILGFHRMNQMVGDALAELQGHSFDHLYYDGYQ